MKFGFRATFRSLFNVKSWLGWNLLVQQGAWIQGMYQGLLRPPQVSSVKETFEEAVARHGYTPDFLKQQEANFSLAATVYLAVLTVGIMYLAWLMFKKQYMAATVMVPLNFMLFSFYFRESFWLMQIRHKRLGMGFQDWLNIVVLGNEQKG